MYSARFIACLLTMTVTACPPVGGQTWIQQSGSNASDDVAAMALNGSAGAFLAGATWGDYGSPNSGYNDAWVALVDTGGNRVWLIQFGTSEPDIASALAADTTGGVYVAGSTKGSLGGIHSDDWDVWFARIDSAGKQTWVRQFGTTRDDHADALAEDDSGGLFVAGSTKGSLSGVNQGDWDCWLARYDGQGDQIWITQFGTTGSDRTFALAADGTGGVFIAGNSYRNLGGENAGGADVWLARYDSKGERTWIRQVGSPSDDFAVALARANGGVVVCGTTSGSLGGPSNGLEDAWLALYDHDGNQNWISQLGTDNVDTALCLSVDGGGGIFIGGKTNGNLGRINAGNGDAWFAHYDSAGNRQWIRQFGTNAPDALRAIAFDGISQVLVAGDTSGSLGGQNSGGQDVFVALYPQPTQVTPPLSGYTVNRGTRLSGNILSMMFSDPYYLKVASAPGDIYEVAETTVRTKSTVLDPVRMDIRTETRATTANVQTRIALRNLNSNTWDTVAQFAQPTVDAVRVIENIPNPQHYIRQTDGLIRIRIQMLRAAWRGPFNKWIDHVQLTVWE